REYALKSGESPEVAQAIEEQYFPQSSDGKLPQSDAGAVVALAEKLDAIVGCFGVDMLPTSASDPYALRRAALGVIRILKERNSMISVSELIELAFDVYPAEATPFKKPKAQLVEEVL